VERKDTKKRKEEIRRYEEVSQCLEAKTRQIMIDSSERDMMKPRKSKGK
jgi:hypothetical protein